MTTKERMKELFFLIMLATKMPGETCQGCSDIHVTVTGFRDAKGDALVALYVNKEGFPTDMSKALRKAKASIENGQARFDFKDVPAGNYALAVLHDQNSNGKIDKNLLGMPKEGYGASNDPKMPMFGPPTFESAVFKTTPGVMNVQFPVHYYPR